ncbi:hypothetical protein, partial [Zoogloea sp.]|uniref:hypothetical protein n=1 Tax=Zoogloea sp. TaxID=49181 RepID=UPI0035B06E64
MTRPAPERDTRSRTPVGSPRDAAERHAERVADALTTAPAGGPLRCAACAAGDGPCPACSGSAAQLRRSALPYAATPAGPTAAVDAALAGPG